MKTSSSEIGKNGEFLAANYLINSGYKILKKNFHFGRFGEIDIIAEKDDVIVFFEIKVQGTDSFGDSKFWITSKKQEKLKKAAEGYLYVNKIQGRDCRFDAIFIDLRKKTPLIEHIENAF